MVHVLFYGGGYKANEGDFKLQRIITGISVIKTNNAFLYNIIICHIIM